MYTVAFTLTGSMPLLQHADDIEQNDILQAWRKDPANKNQSVPGDDRSPAWTWQTYLYSDGEHIALPSQNLMVCLRQAGAQVIMKKQKTFKEISQSGMIIRSEYLPFYVAGRQIPIDAVAALREQPFMKQADAVRKLGFRLFLKRARVGQAKHIRVRPRFDEWTATGTLEVSASDVITRERLEQLFEIAGKVGLGDWRPGCKTPGPFGMFEAKLK